MLLLVYLPSYVQLACLEWGRQCCIFHRTRQFIIHCTIQTLLCKHIKQDGGKRDQNINLSSTLLSGISKVAGECLFSPRAVHFISGIGIRSNLFSPLCKMFLPLSLTVLNSFLLAVSLPVRDYRCRQEEEEGRWQISARHAPGPSVCCQKIEFICVILMLTLGPGFMRVAVAQSEDRIGWWRVEVQASSHPQLLCAHQSGESWPDATKHCSATMTWYSMNRNVYWHVCRGRWPSPTPMWFYYLSSFKGSTMCWFLRIPQINFLSKMTNLHRAAVDWGTWRINPFFG